jgi:hypothetical protein
MQFISLCFRYPDAANVLVPLILVPLAAEAGKRFKEIAASIDAHRATIATTGAPNQDASGIIELGADKKILEPEKPAE